MVNDGQADENSFKIKIFFVDLYVIYVFLICGFELISSI